MPRAKSNDPVNQPEPTVVTPQVSKRGRKYTPKFIQDAQEEVASASATEGRHVPAKEAIEIEGSLTDIWERRLLNPDGVRSTPIRIKTPGMRLRWINLSNRGRYQRARYEQGWIPVNKLELVDEREIGGVSYTAESYVCRGEKQGEMLMKIPEAIYKKIQKRRGEINKKSYKNLRENMASQGASHFKDKYGGSAGDQAAEVAAGFRGDIKFGTERVSTDELLDE